MFQDGISSANKNENEMNSDLRTRVKGILQSYLDNERTYSRYIKKGCEESACRWFWCSTVMKMWKEIETSMCSDFKGERGDATRIYNNLNAFLGWYLAHPYHGDAMSRKDYSPKRRYVQDMIKLVDYNREWQNGLKV